MSALTANSNTLAARPMAWHEPEVKTGVQIYQGAIVCIDKTTGYALPGADTASLFALGIASNQSPPAGAGTAGSSGTYRCQVEPMPDFVEVNASSAGVTWVGNFVYLADDNTVALHGSVTNDICLGVCVDYIGTSGSASRVIVDTRFRSAFVTAA